MDRDPAYLGLLALFHWIAAAIFALFTLIPVILLVTGFAFVTTEAPRWFVVLTTIGWILIGTLLSASLAVAGRSLFRRRRHDFCLAMAGVLCAFFPFGTVLGVLTIRALTKEPVRATFADA